MLLLFLPVWQGSATTLYRLDFFHSQDLHSRSLGYVTQRQTLENKYIKVGTKGKEGKDCENLRLLTHNNTEKAESTSHRVVSPSRCFTSRFIDLLIHRLINDTLYSIKKAQC